jgi:hypothetical protein
MNGNERRPNTQNEFALCLIGVDLRSSAARFAFFVTQSTRVWVETRPVGELSLESHQLSATRRGAIKVSETAAGAGNLA